MTAPRPLKAWAERLRALANDKDTLPRMDSERVTINAGQARTLAALLLAADEAMEVAATALDKASALFLANGKDCGGNLGQAFAEQYAAEFAAARDALRKAGGGA